jgi:hypothetical protein
MMVVPRSSVSTGKHEERGHLVKMRRAQIVRWLGPVVQHYLGMQMPER